MKTISKYSFGIGASGTPEARYLPAAREIEANIGDRHVKLLFA